ncbi:hypothetical protein N7468_006376 [Penicillium chermesinum]|uniref:F-box domain-containing protein n=1 Tax=Penicillium chermesinum TaxID=63820 RepID=A0A9W9NS34_9EURO|nr:uncharacterized protein N7468_006376 [Penicillium chermesinum]KAJ5225151.1 hypothetical protein N7468_006376 [Penicillium chermesinum]
MARISLTSLPPELIQLILQKCDLPSFLQAAFSCRVLLGNACSSCALILHHLQESPGFLDEVNGLTNKQLFRQLLRVARRELYGAEFVSNSKLYKFGGRVIDAHASSLTDVAKTRRVFLVFKNDSTVYLMDVQDGKLTLRRRLESPAEKFGKVDILQTVWDHRGLYVLHRLAPDPTQVGGSFVKDAQQKNSIFLACYDLQAEQETIKLYTLPEESEYKPICLAVHGDNFAISWQHKDEEDSHSVFLYSMDEAYEQNESDTLAEEIEGQPHPQIINCAYSSHLLSDIRRSMPNSDGPQLKGPSVRLAFNDRGKQLLHYYRAQTLFGSFHRVSNLDPIHAHRAIHNKCNVQFSTSLSLQFSIGIPFFGAHVEGDIAAGVPCHWRYLAVGIATHRVEHWTVACILMSESFPRAQRCTHVMNIERGRRFDEWSIMAQLGGYEESITSQGSLIAASVLGTRLAMASWKTVTVWPINPQCLITYLLDYDYDIFYRNSCRSEEGHLILRPVVIQLDAVCCQLQFTDDENELIAITDKGLIILHLEPNGKGARVVIPREDELLTQEMG